MGPSVSRTSRACPNVNIAAKHPDSAASEVIKDAGFVVEPAVNVLADTLDRALDGERPTQKPTSKESVTAMGPVRRQVR